MISITKAGGHQSQVEDHVVPFAAVWVPPRAPSMGNARIGVPGGGSLEHCSSSEHWVGRPHGQHSMKQLSKWEWGAQELNYLERVNCLGYWLGEVVRLSLHP